QLEAILARVAGSRHQRRDAGHGALGERERPHPRQVDCGQRAQRPLGPRALVFALRSCTASPARAWATIHAKSASVFEAFTTSTKRARVIRNTTRSSSTPPVSLHRTEYCPSPSPRRLTSFTVSSWHSAAAPSPRSWISPMWLTSKRPQCAQIGKAH